ncbi:50S ribosomal protein L1 [Paracoccidioides lutzii Pb01]|uniref:50S ribosomal protein L1 n=1 Tax=Paracoccidioides lutzii (strain ATCC MYA-826 / Pb01) TaxID=502779 RepID=C1H0J2_PARBA|nr:50S ribosomal protein L1 [Paracoccidioides lutzii Pb01]EEH33233.2 50S ribosomal protein L1 [Paracoccidioides lutzii Pb01]
MAAPSRYMSSLRRGIVSAFRPPIQPNPTILPFFLFPVQRQSRYAQTQAKKSTKAKKKYKTYIQHNMKDAVQFTLCDAMRWIRAFEVGRPLSSVKYEIHVRLSSNRGGTVIRNQIRLPHSVHPLARVCVICPPDSRAAKEAASVGAEVIGQEEVFEQIKEENINFDLCICHTSSLAAMNKAGLGRILGPRGLMPSAKMGTVVDNIAKTVRSMRGSTTYRERMGVIRLAIGQLGFSPDQLKQNIVTLISQLKKDAAAVDDSSKEILEVVLSSTNSPGFSLNGDFRSPDSPPVQALTGN